MAMAGVFGLFAATYYWFPLVTGRLLSEHLGRWHFWGSLLGAYSTFLPMHLTGLAGEPRHYAQLTGLPNAAAAQLLATTISLNRHITWSAFFLAGFQLVFFANLVWSLRRGEVAPENPWQATTMEWMPGLYAATEESELGLAVYREPAHYDDSLDDPTPRPQWQPPVI